MRATLAVNLSENFLRVTCCWALHLVAHPDAEVDKDAVGGVEDHANFSDLALLFNGAGGGDAEVVAVRVEGFAERGLRHQALALLLEELLVDSRRVFAQARVVRLPFAVQRFGVLSEFPLHFSLEDGRRAW